MRWSIEQPIGLLSRAERRDTSAAPTGPFLVVWYNPQEEDEDGAPAPRFQSAGQFEQLCAAVASIIEGSGVKDRLVEALVGLRRDLQRNQDHAADDEVAFDDLSFDELRERLIAGYPELAPLEGMDYLSFALDGCFAYTTDVTQSPYFEDIDDDFPAWDFCIGWSAEAPMQDTAVAILMARAAPPEGVRPSFVPRRRRGGGRGKEPEDESVLAAEEALFQAVEEAAHRRDWDAVILASEQLFAIEPLQNQGMLIRAKVYAEQGRWLLASALLGAALRDIDEEAFYLVEWQRLSFDVEKNCKSAPARGQDYQELGGWFTRWKRSPRWIHGAQLALEALVEVLPRWERFWIENQDSRFFLHKPSRGRIRENLERLSREVRDSPTLIYHLGRVTGDDSSEASFEQALALLESGAALSAAATELEAAAVHVGVAASKAQLLEQLTQIASRAERWEAAARYAEEWVAADPENHEAWSDRANALAFTDRVEDALSAYNDSLREWDRVMQNYVQEGDRFVRKRGRGLVLDGDPRAIEWYNRSTLHSKLGHRDLALEDLRRAILVKPGFIRDAEGEAYFDSLRDDPDFLEILRSVGA